MTHDFYNDKTVARSNSGPGTADSKAGHLASGMPADRTAGSDYLYKGSNGGGNGAAKLKVERNFIDRGSASEMRLDGHNGNGTDHAAARSGPGMQLFKPEMAEARSQGLLNIGEAAAASGVSAKSIRHYETIGLIPQANRTFANYRLYRQEDVQTLSFIRSARALGFSIPRIGELLSLWQNRQRSSVDVKRLAMQHVDELDTNIRELQRMRDTISSLAQNCQGDSHPDCPILQSLASPES